MIDISTKKPLRVLTNSDTGPYIMVSVKQVDDVRALFDAEKIPYWVDEYAISINNGPEMTVINLKYGTDVSVVRNILENTHTDKVVSKGA